MEIIISMLILSLVVAGIYSLFINSTAYIIEAQHRLQAVNYARQVAEAIKVYVSADPNNPANAGTVLSDGTNPHDPVLGTDLGLDPINIPGVTNLDWYYDVAVNDPDQDMTQVTITVEWDEP